MFYLQTCLSLCPSLLAPRSSSQLIDSNRKGRIAHLQLKGCSSSLGRKTQCCLKLKTTRTHPPPHTYSEKPVFEHARTDHSFRASQWRSVSVYPHLCAVYRLPTCVFRWLPVWPCHVKYPSPACRPERNSNFALHVCVCVCVCVCLCLVGLLTSLCFGNEDFFTKTLDWYQSHKREWLFPYLGAEVCSCLFFFNFLVVWIVQRWVDFCIVAGKLFTPNRAGNIYFRRQHSLLSVFEECIVELHSAVFGICLQSLNPGISCSNLINVGVQCLVYLIVRLKPLHWYTVYE